VKNGAFFKTSAQGIRFGGTGLQQVLEIRVTAAPLPCSRHRPDLRLALAQAPKLRIPKEENLVLDHRATDRAPELVPAQFSLFSRRASPVVAIMLKEVSGIENVIAEKFPNVPMKLIGARFQSRVEHGCAGTPILGAEVCGLNLEFLNRVDRRQDYEVRSIEKVNRIGIVVNSIEHVVVLSRTTT